MDDRLIKTQIHAGPRLGLTTAGLMLLSAITFIVLALMTRAHAADEGVYGPAAPPDSAFIRLFNATNQQVDGARIADKLFAEVMPYGASEFTFLPAGGYSLTVGGASQSLTLDRNKFYTAVWNGRELRLIATERFSNRMKSLVILYNLTDAPQLALKTPDGKTSVTDPVGSNAAVAREVNAVRVNLAVYDGDKKVADAKPVNLQRGKAFSLFATGSKDQPMTVWVVN
jgi:alginate O-acetyltransferase complex protein AlgF